MRQLDYFEGLAADLHRTAVVTSAVAFALILIFANGQVWYSQLGMIVAACGFLVIVYRSMATRLVSTIDDVIKFAFCLIISLVTTWFATGLMLWISATIASILCSFVLVRTTD